VSRREQIEMAADELAAFLQLQRTVICATLGKGGWPHLMPLWYVLRVAPEEEVEIWAWTYAASQKTRNLERDPRATLLVETGELYQELRGVMLECDVTIHRELERVAALGREIFARYAAPAGEDPVSELDVRVTEMVTRQAPKRVALQFRERRRVSWDHRKLGGIY
jgi:general stress protein 26